MKNNDELPEGWIIKKLDDACNIIMGQSPPGNTYNKDKSGLPFFQGKAEFGVRYPTVVKWCSKPKKVAYKNDVLISVRAPVGPTNIASSDCCIGRGLAVIRPLEGTDYLYVFYYLRSIEHELAQMGTGSTFKAISGSDLKSLLFPVAPTNEQHLIVSELEKQFSRLDEAVAALKRIKANLKRYKASVLKAAVEGKLTEEWRKQNPDIESADKLLERIKKERSLRGVERRSKLRGKEEIASPLARKDNLPELPKGWVWASLDQISDINPSIEKKNIPDDLLVSFVPMAEVGAENGYINVNNTRPFLQVKKGFTNFLEGDVLFAKITPCMENGKIVVVPSLSSGYGFGSTEFHVIRPYSGVNPYFIYYIVSNLSYRKEAAHHMTGAVGQKRVPASFLKGTTIPLPSLEEQLQIISEVKQRISI
ncbi:MAG: restriction endonuclease subunit S, partial [candidate division NC10 bacterium]